MSTEYLVGPDGKPVSMAQITELKKTDRQMNRISVPPPLFYIYIFNSCLIVSQRHFSDSFFKDTGYNDGRSSSLSFDHERER